MISNPELIPRTYINTYDGVQGYHSLDVTVLWFQQRFCQKWASGYAWAGIGQHLPVTSARDGKHTKGSVHPNGLAVDIGLANLYRMATVSREELTLQLFELLGKMVLDMKNEGLVVILKPDEGHIHIQKTWQNIKGGPGGNNFYPLLLSSTARKWIIKARKER